MNTDEQYTRPTGPRFSTYAGSRNATAAPAPAPVEAPAAPARMFVTKGNGKAVHIGRTYIGTLATLCDGWGDRGATSSRIRPTAGPATCKSCLRNA